MKIEVNGINLFYEEYGEGTPIILIHGNSEEHSIFDKMIEHLKDTHKVYAVDSRCHGKSDKTKEISYDLLASDYIEFIKKLKIEKPIIYGFSDGGIIALLIAIKEKDLLSRIVISGANVTPDGVNKKMQRIMKVIHFFTRNKLIKMMILEPNMTKEELASITIPVNVLAGEFDVIDKEHTEYIHNSLKFSTLEFVKGEDHGSYIIHNEKIYEIIKKYI